MGCGTSTSSGKRKKQQEAQKKAKQEEAAAKYSAGGGKTGPNGTPTAATPADLPNGAAVAMTTKYGVITITSTTNKPYNFNAKKMKGKMVSDEGEPSSPTMASTAAALDALNGSSALNQEPEKESFLYTDFVISGSEIESLKNHQQQHGSGAPSPKRSEGANSFLDDDSSNRSSSFDGAISFPVKNNRHGVNFMYGDFALLLTDEYIDRKEIDKGRVDITNMSITALYRKPVRCRGLRHVTSLGTLGHKSRIKVLRVAPDDTRLFSCGADEKTLRCTDLVIGRTHEVVLTFDGHEDVLMDAAVSLDQKVVATASRDDTVILWDGLTAKKQRTIEVQSLIIFVRISQDGAWVLVGFQDPIATVYDARTGEEKCSYTSHSAVVSSGNFNHDATLITTGSVAGEMSVWQTDDATERLTLKAHSGAVMQAMFSTDSNAVVTCDDRNVRVWDPKGTGRLFLQIPIDASPSLNPISSAAVPPPSPRARPGGQGATKYLTCAFLPNNMIGITRSNRTVSIVTLTSGEEVWSEMLRANAHTLVTGEKTVAVGDANGNVYLWSLEFMV
eukprot:PhM_4_TR8368/c0_g1_i1/m.14575